MSDLLIEEIEAGCKEFSVFLSGSEEKAKMDCDKRFPCYAFCCGNKSNKQNENNIGISGCPN